MPFSFFFSSADLSLRVCNYMLYRDILVSSLDHCNWNEPNDFSNWMEFYQESFLSFFFEERKMFRWYFISVERNGNDSKMILRSCLPVSLARSRLNQVKIMAIPIFYFIVHVSLPVFVRETSFIAEYVDNRCQRLIWRYIVLHNARARFRSDS